MDFQKFLDLVHSILEKEHINHALIGGFALGVWNVSRLTSDIDFLVDGTEKEKLKKAFLKSGFFIKHESAEVMQFHGLGDVDFLFANRDLSRQMLKEAKFIEDFSVKCVGVEDLIGLKIQAYCNDPKREFQDKADIQALIHKNPSLDWEKVLKYAQLFSQTDELENIRRKNEA